MQSCSGGGGRIDAGILGRTDQVWVSDNTDAFDRLAIQEGFSLAYPARTMEAWVTDSPNEITHRRSRLCCTYYPAERRRSTRWRFEIIYLESNIREWRCGA